MRTIIIGAGEVGFHIAERLSREGHDVVIVEQDSAVRQRVQEELDVMAVEGSGSSPRILEQAGIREADLIIAVADIDEVNVTACLLAKEYGVPKRIARVRDPDFSESPFLEQGRRLGVDLLINPTIVVAEEILDLIKTPAAAEVGKFADGKVVMLGLQIGAAAPILERPLKALRAFHATTPFLVVAIQRQNRILLPDGATTVEEGDHLYFVSKRECLNDILTLLGKKESIIERVLVIGGGRLGTRVAQRLEQDRYKVKLLERSQVRCEELSRLLEHTLVLHGDGTDVQTLLEEGIADTDAVVSVTDDEAINILAALLAKEQGAKKVMARIKRPHLLHLLPHLGIDAAISPRILTANVILKYIRRGRVLSIFEIPESDAETLEMVVAPHARISGKPIRDAGLPLGAIIGAVVHHDEILIPKGETVLHPEDRVILFALPKAIPDVERLFA
ncbi:MAG TPA: Trk system potassium transporter TrkA [Candidatus Methylomirabilis sp.]|nr:Trk system potassium transporter TrkA [Candidatus Methylomirabilis sp.]